MHRTLTAPVIKSLSVYYRQHAQAGLVSMLIAAKPFCG